MRKKSYYARRAWKRISLALVVVALSAVPAVAGAPDWFRAASNASLPTYPDETAAVVLFSEQTVTVSPDGQVKTVFRRAYRILRPQGREDYGKAVVYFDDETRLTYFKAWSLSAKGIEYEAKEKDAIESSMVADQIYQDLHYKVLDIPAAGPGSVVGFEYEQKGRPHIMQSEWTFQAQIPVLKTRFTLELPKGWQFDVYWRNHAPVSPTAAGEGRWRWEFEDLTGEEEEESMPAWRAVAGRMGISYRPPGSESHAGWTDVASWYKGLSAGRREATPEIRRKVAELTVSAKSDLDKLHALTSFVQRQIRYVAIEIGIGGFQPHPAGDIYGNRYGDCKDKATLLSAMLHEVGIESYYVLINVHRGVVADDFPSPLGFNHVILALRLPASIPDENFFAVIHDRELGSLLFFDPTDSITPLGSLNQALQQNSGLLVTESGGQLVSLPLLPPTTNRLLRVATLSLDTEGRLSGTVREVRWGSFATERRAELRHLRESDRTVDLENFLGNFLGAFRLAGSKIDGLDDNDANLVIDYGFVGEHYSQIAGDLMLLRARVLGEKGSRLLETKVRKYPIEFSGTDLQSDIFQIKLPPGYRVDELPQETDLKSSFADYMSRTELADNVLTYRRTLTLKNIQVPLDRMEEMKKFYRQVAQDERSTVVLKHSAQ